MSKKDAPPEKIPGALFDINFIKGGIVLSK
jgi:hypothetical protein